jgi:hypothetical protein
MKKQLLITGTLVAGIFTCQAQVTLTQSNHAPVPGDMNPVKQIDTTANIRSILRITGNGVTWDFTGTMYSNGGSFTDYYVNPASLPGTSTYTNAGATVALSDSGGFYRVSATKTEYLGDIGSSGEITDFTSNPPDLMHYPFSYGSNYTEVGNGTMTVPNMPPFTLNGTITVSADGQGTLILPSNPNIVYNNALKIHMSVTLHIQGTGSLSTVTGTQTIEDFDYYVSSQKFPVFKVHYEKLSIPAFGVNNFKFEGEHISSITLGVNTLSENKTTIYPNPVKDIIYLTNNDILSINKITISDILGKNIMTFDLYKDKKNIEIPINNLNKGIYFIHVLSKDNSVQTLKFIKE